MGRDVEMGKQNKRILVVGYMGYHEETTIKPILAYLASCEIYRLGGNMDFFIPDNTSGMIENWLSSLNGVNLADWDIVFFVDYWNMVIPMFLYKKGIENPSCRFVALCHGTVHLEDDLANDIPNSSKYEDFLYFAYDTILVPGEWLKRLMGGNVVVTQWPVEILMGRVRPGIKPVKRVIFAHRWQKDKGTESFLKFVKTCQNDSDLKDTEFIVTDDNPMLVDMGIVGVGWLNQTGLKELCSKGGYAWSSVKSETFGYTILDLISYGLTPIINNHPAYYHIPNKYKYGGNNYYKFDEFSFGDVKEMILSGLHMPNTEWEQVIFPMKDNSRIMAEAILG